jgi:hypothetical protein
MKEVKIYMIFISPYGDCPPPPAGHIFHLSVIACVYSTVQGGALNRGLFFAGPPPSLLGAVSGNISEIR